MQQTNFKVLFFAVASGLIFGLGLILAGMANPAKVLGFLDLSGAWDPSLALVMGAAIVIGAIAFAIAKKRHLSYLGLSMHLPTNRVIDQSLILGSMAFGIGWGLAGICPGPAIVLLGAGSFKGLIFFIAMMIGMGLYELLESRKNKAANQVR